MMDMLFQEAFRGLFIPYRLQMVLAGEETSYFGTGGTPEAENTYLHETMHWWQTSMTGYGHASWSIFRQLTGFIVREWVEATNGNSSGRLFSVPALTKYPTAENAQLFSARLACESVLTLAMARQSAPTTKRTVSELADTPLLAGMDWLIAPTIQFGDMEHRLQGIDIIEAQAHLVATQFSSGVHKMPMERFGTLSRKYWIAFAWFASQVDESQLSLFSLICDLALMTIWNDQPTSEEEWRASCPSWRFVNLTNKLANVDLSDPKDAVSDYSRIAQTLLSACGYATVDEVIRSALEKATWRLPLMSLEERMLNGIRFRQRFPWCVAFPMADSNVWKEMLNNYAAPSIQVEGALRMNLPNSNSEEASKLGMEISGELMLQAWALQLLGIPPKTTPIPETIQCGFRYFDVQDVCPHQITDNCTGSFNPADGSPHPADMNNEEGLSGCPFEKLLWGAGVRITDIKLQRQ